MILTQLITLILIILISALTIYFLPSLVNINSFIMKNITDIILSLFYIVKSKSLKLIIFANMIIKIYHPLTN